MFTGLVETVGKVVSLGRTPSGAELTVQADDMAPQVQPGDSVAVNGACLTVVRVEGAGLAFDLSAETLSRTTLSCLAVAQRVNLERALKVGDRLGGHFVSGHVDAIAKVQSRRNVGDQWTFRFGVPAEAAALMVPKGSVAVDGISLTIVECTSDGFSVAVIPFTYQHTTLSDRPPGASVNIETDMLAKMVFKAMGRLPGQGISEGFLREHGF